MTKKAFWERYRLFIEYNIFGFTATLMETFLYWLFYRVIELSNVQATLIAWIITVIYAFFTNKIFVYKSNFWRFTSVAIEFASFFGFRVITGVYNVFHMWLTVDILSWWPVPMKAIAALIVGLMNYLLGKWVVFKKGMNEDSTTK